MTNPVLVEALGTLSHGRSQSESTCWTCFLREVECDGAVPACSTCDAANLQCDGYEKKPEWIDHPEKKRRRVEVIKDIIRRQRKRNWTVDSFTSPPNSSRSVRVRAATIPPTNLSLSPESTLPELAPLWTAEGFGDTIEFDAMHTFTLDSDFPLATSIAPFALLPTPVSQERQELYDVEAETISAEVPKISCPPQQLHKVGFSSPFPSKSWVSINSEEAELLLHYMEHTFWDQYPPVVRGSSTDRGWLFVSATQSQASLHAMLCLSAHHISPNVGNSSVQGLEPRPLTQTYYANALKAMSEEISHSESEVYALAAVFQLIFVEALQHDLKMWKLHMQDASKIIRAYAAEANDTNAQRLSSTTEFQALQVLVPAFIRIDILSATFLRMHTAADSTFSGYQQILQQIKIEIKSTSRDEFVVLFTIAQITELNQWKKVKSTKGAMSMVELISRGVKVQKHLHMILNKVGISEWSSLLSQSEVSSPCQSTWPQSIASASDETLVTILFANAALTYLHVVLSGAFPGLAETSELVYRNLSLLQYVTQDTAKCSSLIGGLLWPLCISGCMATENNERLFRDIILSASKYQGVGSLASQRLLSVLEVMEKCWTMRRNDPSVECDWASAATSLGRGFLIV